MPPRVIVIAPHPDDETLGVGGTLLRKKAEGAIIAWVIVTKISTEFGWTAEKVKQRDDEIDRVAQIFGTRTASLFLWWSFWIGPATKNNQHLRREWAQIWRNWVTGATGVTGVT